MRWWLGAGADAAALAPLLERALARVAGAEDLRSGRRKRLFRLSLGPGSEPDHLLKRCGYPPSRGWLRHARGSKARRELAIAEALAERGVPVVVPLAAGERRRAGRLVECFLLAPLLEGAIDLRRLWGDPALTPRRRRQLARSLGEIVRQAHSAGLHQDDLAPNNVLVGSGEALRLVDFERARLRRRVGDRARRRMLAKLARATAAAPATQQLRFLRAYAGGAREARRWWEALRAEAPRLARRDYTRLSRVSTRDGRRFREIERGDWRGFARRGAEIGLELAQLAASAPPASGNARVESEAGRWRVIYPRLSPRRARRLWARAHALAARGLAPAPLAVLSGPRCTLLIVGTVSDARPLGAPAGSSAERQAAARLLARLAGLGELGAGLAPEAFLLLGTGSGPVSAQLVAPHAFRFGGRPGGRRSRELSARLLAALAPPPSAV